jgi:hypothetical protein
LKCLIFNPINYRLLFDELLLLELEELEDLEEPEELEELDDLEELELDPLE